MRKFGLIGRKLSHSYSALYFKNKWENDDLIKKEYDLIELDDEELLRVFLSSQNGYSGFNITIPFKEVACTMVAELTKEAHEIGAINCVVNKNGKWLGHNTDGIAFLNTLENFIDSKTVKKALVLGTGGASKAVCWALKKLQIEPLTISSTGKSMSYLELLETKLHGFNLIINTTPLGMYPDHFSFPNIPYEQFGKQSYAYDLIYNPEETVFLKKLSERGVKIKNGLEMFFKQAELSEAFWNVEINKDI